MTLSLYTAVLILFAALGHAIWNTLVKSGADKLVMQTVVIASGGVICVLLTPFVAIPAAASWPYLIASVVVHLFYFLSLTYAYEHGDLSQVYPIARGAAPALVALFAWIVVGEALSAIELTGLVIVCIGIISLSRLPLLFTARVTPRPGELRAITFSLLTALCIGTYSLLDGMGGRLSENVFGYIVWSFVLSTLPLLTLTLWRRRGRIIESFKPCLVVGTAGGVIGGMAYATVIWALSVAPMAHVVALRETSVIIAALIGTRLLREPFGVKRLLAATAIACGAAMLATSR